MTWYASGWGGLTQDPQRAMRNPDGSLMAISDADVYGAGADNESDALSGYLFGGGNYSTEGGIPYTLGPNGEPVYSDMTSPLGAGIGSVGNNIYGNVSGGSSSGYDAYGNPVSNSTSGTSTGTSLGSNINTSTSGGSYNGGDGSSYFNSVPNSVYNTDGSLRSVSGSSGSGGGGGSGDTRGDWRSTGSSGTSATTSSNLTGRNTVGSTSTSPSTSVYAVSPAAYIEGMNAELSELDQGRAAVQALIQNAGNMTQSQLSAALNDISSKTGLGINELQSTFQQGIGAVNQGYGNAINALNTQYGEAINQYAPITAGAAGDMDYLRQGTMRGFDDDFARYQQSEAFQAPLRSATNDINQSAAAARMKFSSGNLKNLGKYISDYTAKGYNDYRAQRMGEAQSLANTSLNALGQQTNLRGTLGSQLASTFGAQGSNVGQLQGQYGTNASNAYSTLGANLAGFRQGFTGLNNTLSTSLAEATGQYYGARADARNRGITGRGTRPIEIRV